jgi:antitoxin component YwqK of YwqJK toxin-antitoxin module
VLAEEIGMKDGQPDGLSRAYYPSGCLKAEVTLRNGKVENKRFWKDGEQNPSALSKLKKLIR